MSSIPENVSDRGKRVYFISDLHLGAAYDEAAKATEKKAVEFLDSIRNDASEIYLLGDILDYWFEYRFVVPRGYVRFFGKLAELTDSGIRVTWLIGNHDIWIFDYIPSELGVEVVDGMLERDIMGVPFCMQHGDAIGGGRKFRFLRSLFRNKFCQRLYSGIHPRWTVGFAHSCSCKSRLGEYRKMEKTGENPDNLIGGIRRWCIKRIEDGDPALYFMFGHLHRRYDESLPDGRRLIVLPAFPAGGSYAVFDGKTLELME